jgi:hypothetical protein
MQNSTLTSQLIFPPIGRQDPYKNTIINQPQSPEEVDMLVKNGYSRSILNSTPLLRAAVLSQSALLGEPTGGLNDFKNLSDFNAQCVVGLFMQEYLENFGGTPSDAWKDQKYRGYGIGGLVNLGRQGEVRVLAVLKSLLYNNSNLTVVTFDGSLNGKKVKDFEHIEELLTSNGPEGFDIKSRNGLPFCHPGNGLVAFENQVIRIAGKDYASRQRDYIRLMLRVSHEAFGDDQLKELTAPHQPVGR